jgi:hypothetical protein
MNAEAKTLHFDLRHADPHEKYKLHAGLNEYTLQLHEEATIDLAIRAKPGLAAVPRHAMTHFAADVALPTEAPIMLMVTSPSRVTSAKLDELILTTIHIPTQARKNVSESLRRSGRHRGTPNHLRFAAPNAAPLADKAHLEIDVYDWNTAFQAACNLVFMHGELCNLDATTAARVMHIIEFSKGIDDLAAAILNQAKEHLADPEKQNWAVEDYWRDPQGNPDKNRPRYQFSAKTREWLKSPIADALRRTKNTLELESTTEQPGCWKAPYGATFRTAPPAGAPLNIMADQDQPAYNWTITNSTTNRGVSIESKSYQGGALNLGIGNVYLRYLSAYSEYIRADGSLIQQNGQNRNYEGMINAVDTILGIPITGGPLWEPAQFALNIPTDAVSANLYLGGMGQVSSYDPQVCAGGIAMTAIFNIILPTALLGAGAAIGLVELAPVRRAAFNIIPLEINTWIKFFITIANRAGGRGLALDLIEAGVDLVLGVPALMAAIATIFEVKALEGALEKAEPFVGWIATAIDVVTDVAMLLETSIEVGTSPAVYKIQALRTIAADWQLTPDPNAASWPEQATRYVVLVTYLNGGTPICFNGQMPAPNPLAVHFDSIPAGDNVQVQFEAKFYSDTGFLCGQAQTGVLFANATQANTLVVPQMSITQNRIPLNAQTQYAFSRSLAYDAAKQNHVYRSGGSPPTATIKNLNAGNDGHNLGRLAAIAFATMRDKNGVVIDERVAYAFQASGQNLPLLGFNVRNDGQMYTIQEASVARDGDRQAIAGLMTGGFEGQPMVIADARSSPDNVGRDFLFIDPRDTKNPHIRRLQIGSDGKFILAQKSLGRFNQPIDACAVHRSGIIIAINRGSSKIETLLLGEEVDDSKAPIAEIHAGEGDRRGLIRSPIALAVFADAGAIILSEGDRSNFKDCPPNIQAFDLSGNPHPRFKKKTTPYLELHPETAPTTYLDVITEAGGYIYLLKYLNDGANPSDYVVDIHDSDGSYLTKIAGLSAAKIAVNFWRNLYALTYETIAKPEGGATEPVLSIWTPKTP